MQRDDCGESPRILLDVTLQIQQPVNSKQNLKNEVSLHLQIIYRYHNKTPEHQRQREKIQSNQKDAICAKES